MKFTKILGRFILEELFLEENDRDISRDRMLLAVHLELIREFDDLLQHVVGITHIVEI